MLRGGQIINDKGTPISLKGIVRSSLEWNKQGQYLSPDDIALIASWGGNIIRIDLNQQFWFDSQPIEKKGSYKQIIDAIIYESIKNNMAVILDLHWTLDKQESMANKDAVKFWTEVATAYKDFGTVIF